jgi:hypothetical protein
MDAGAGIDEDVEAFALQGRADRLDAGDEVFGRQVGILDVEARDAQARDGGHGGGLAAQALDEARALPPGLLFTHLATRQCAPIFP